MISDDKERFHDSKIKTLNLGKRDFGRDDAIFLHVLKKIVSLVNKLIADASLKINS